MNRIENIKINILDTITKEQREAILKIINGTHGHTENVVMISCVNDNKLAQCTCGTNGLFLDYDYVCPNCGTNIYFEHEYSKYNNDLLLGIGYNVTKYTDEELEVVLYNYSRINSTHSSYEIYCDDDYPIILKFNNSSKELKIYQDKEEITDLEELETLYCNGDEFIYETYKELNVLPLLFQRYFKNIKCNETYTLIGRLIDIYTQVKIPMYRDENVSKCRFLKQFTDYGHCNTSNLNDIDKYYSKLKESYDIDVDKETLTEAFHGASIADILSITSLDDYKYVNDFDNFVLKYKLTNYLEYFKETKDIVINGTEKVKILEFMTKINIDFDIMIKFIFRGINNEDVTLTKVLKDMNILLSNISEFPIDFTKPYSQSLVGKINFYKQSNLDKNILDSIGKKPTLSNLYSNLFE